jgi:hypothetical protein
MRSITGFGRKITNWELVSTNLKPHLDEMTQVKPLAEELSTVIEEAWAIDSELEASRGRKQELARRRNDAEKKGEDLRRRISSILRGGLGFTSEQLIQFGVKPARTGRRGKRASPKPAEGGAVAKVAATDPPG